MQDKGCPYACVGSFLELAEELKMTPGLKKAALLFSLYRYIMLNIMQKIPKKRMLVVDDEISILIAYKQLFGNNDFDVDISDNFCNAEEFLSRNQYSVIITDLELSESRKHEGLEVVRKARDNMPDAIIVLATAYGNERIRRTAREAGVNYYFEKPLKIEKIKGILNKIPS